ncbi:MAG: hypothetical protein ACE5GX_04275 [Thermoanaerobaculia bacterium]
MRALRTLAFLAAFSAFYLLVAGAHVNAYQAALSVPDWPLSYGHILAPEWRGNVFYEQHHRATAATTMILFTAVLVWLARRKDLVDARRWGWRAGVALAIQVVMGGLIVLTLNPPWLSAVHTLIAVVTVVLIAATALALLGASGKRAGGGARENAAIARAYGRARIGIALVLVQVGLGGVTRHPPAGELVFITTLMAHLLVGVLLLFWLSLLAVSVVRNATAESGGRALGRWGWFLLGALVLQVGVGAWVFVVSPEPFDQTWPPPAGFANAHAAHIVLSAFIATCLVAIRFRGSGPRSADAAAAQSPRYTARA